jgi:DNA polymerase elongation subunit (family B)
MTPQEKAKELLAKMTTNADSLIYKNQYAKECALIAVDEILKAIGFSDNKFYWQEVKQEIEKL